MRIVNTIATALCRVVETLQSNPLGGVMLLMMLGLVVMGLWAAKA